MSYDQKCKHVARVACPHCVIHALSLTTEHIEDTCNQNKCLEKEAELASEVKTAMIFQRAPKGQSPFSIVACCPQGNNETSNLTNGACQVEVEA